MPIWAKASPSGRGHLAHSEHIPAAPTPSAPTEPIQATLSASPSGSKRVICTAKTVKTGRQLYFAAAEVHDDDGNLVATADAVYAYVDRDAQRQKSGS